MLSHEANNRGGEQRRHLHCAFDKTYQLGNRVVAREGWRWYSSRPPPLSKTGLDINDHIPVPPPLPPPRGDFCAGILEQSMGAWNRVGTGLSYRPARLHRLAASLPWTRFLDSLNVFKYGLCPQHIVLKSGKNCYTEPDLIKFIFVSFLWENFLICVRIPRIES